MSDHHEHDEPPAPISAGETVADRYRIVRFIARGGMGEVYEAHDIELDRLVALKTIRTTSASDTTAIARFRREIALASRVTHPNVSRIYDLGRHRGATVDVTFLTMELLSGPTLDEFVRGRGKLSVAEALPLVSQMAAGLAAAHEEGIVHRDFKPANVMLVPRGNSGQKPALSANDETVNLDALTSSDSTTAVESVRPDDSFSTSSFRVVVTDFGLAQFYGTDAGAGVGVEQVTQSGMVVGTPAFMAPEQAEGGRATSRSDIYALGVVMFQMVTGRLPHSGDTPFALLAHRMTLPPVSPLEFTPDLDRNWVAVILRCLETKPDNRYSSVLEILPALRQSIPHPGAEESTQVVPTQAAPGKRKLWSLAGIALVLALIAVGVFVFQKRPGRTGPSPSVIPASTGRIPAGRSVAVLGFQNLSQRAEVNWLSTALSEMMTTEVGSGQTLRALPGESVARMKTDLGLGEFSSLSAETLGRIRAHLGADLIVSGSFLALGEKSDGAVRLDIRIQDTAGGETVGTVSEEGSESNLPALVSRVGSRIREALGASPAGSASAGIQSSLPSSPEALRYYAQGLEKLRLFDAESARELLTKAVGLAGDFPLAHLALSDAHAALGYDRLSQQHAKRAFDLSRNLSQEDQLVIEGRYRSADEKWDQAIPVYKRLVGLAPDNIEYGLRLAAVQTAAGSSDDAIETLVRLRKRAQNAGSDGRVDLAEALTRESIGDSKGELAAATAAIAKGEKAGARVLVAEARLRHAWASKLLGNAASSKDSLVKARTIFQSVSNRKGVADALTGLGLVASEKGDFLEARTLYNEAVAVQRDIGNKKGMAQALNNLALVAWNQSNLEEATQIFSECAKLYRETGSEGELAGILNNLGEVRRAAGDLVAAERSYLDALKSFQSLNHKRGVAICTNNLGDVARYTSDLKAAEQRYGETDRLASEIGLKSLNGYASVGMGEVYLARGQMTEARAALERARQIWKGSGDDALAAEAEMALASLDLEEGTNPGRARQIASQAAAFFGRAAAPERQAAALEIVARSYLPALNVRGDTAAQGAAGNQIQQARQLVEKTASAFTSQRIAITSARLSGRETGRVAAPLDQLRATLPAIKASRYFALEAETRLAIGEIEILSGNVNGGRQTFLSVVRDAESRGQLLIASKAREALRKISS